VTTKRELRPPSAVPMRTLHGLSREMRDVQQAVQDATRAARGDQKSRGKALRCVFDPAAPYRADATVKGNPATVSHGLGRKPQGIEARKAASAVSYTVGTMTSKLVTFDSIVGSGTVEFWVY